MLSKSSISYPLSSLCLMITARKLKDSRHTYKEFVTVAFLPSEELPSVITRSLPIGLSMPGSPIPLFLPFILVGYDEHGAHYNDYYSHILVFVFYGMFNFISCSVINFNNIRGSKYFPESLHLQDKCRCGPVVRLPELPLVAIFCPAHTC